MEIFGRKNLEKELAEAKRDRRISLLEIAGWKFMPAAGLTLLGCFSALTGSQFENKDSGFYFSVGIGLMAGITATRFGMGPYLERLRGFNDDYKSNSDRIRYLKGLSRMFCEYSHKSLNILGTTFFVYFTKNERFKLCLYF